MANILLTIVLLIMIVIRLLLPIILVIAGVLLIKYLYTKLKNEEDKRL